jgi:hypothetical protein
MRSYLYEAELLVAAAAALVLFAFGESDETYSTAKSIDLVVAQASPRASRSGPCAMMHVSSMPSRQRPSQGDGCARQWSSCCIDRPAKE